MFKQLFKTAILATILLVVATTSANIPPPPVNQNLGIADGVFNNMTFQTCLGCHGDPVNAPAPVNIGYLPDRHHLRVDTPIEEFSASPYPGDSPDDTHKCITCHKVDWVTDSSRPLGGYFKFALDPSEPEFRNCLSCHEQKPGIASVHHLTQKAQDAQCPLCHGSLVNFPYGDHYIPDYRASIITPWPGDNYDTSSPSNQFDPPIADYNDRRTGNCEHCHFSGTDQITGRFVPTNYETHHGTGVGQPNSGSVHGCDLCHDFTPPEHTIRACQKCHGAISLHTIEFDAEGDGISPGSEEPFMGHIGNAMNCNGCHINWQVTGGIPTGAFGGAPPTNVIPTIDHVELEENHASNTRSIVATQSIGSRTLFFSGSGFISIVGDEKIIAKLVLTNKEGLSFEYGPTVSTPTTLEFILPEDLAPGSYDVNLSKKTLKSPTINLAIRPDVIVSDIKCGDSEIILNGSGFSKYLDTEGSGTSIVNMETSKECRIKSWNNNQIITDCGPGDVGDIQINNIFGSTVADAACEKDTGGRPDWWSLWAWFASWGWAGR